MGKNSQKLPKNYDVDSGDENTRKKKKKRKKDLEKIRKNALAARFNLRKRPCKLPTELTKTLNEFASRREEFENLTHVREANELKKKSKAKPKITSNRLLPRPMFGTGFFRGAIKGKEIINHEANFKDGMIDEETFKDAVLREDALGLMQDCDAMKLNYKPLSKLISSPSKKKDFHLHNNFKSKRKQDFQNIIQNSSESEFELELESSDLPAANLENHLVLDDNKTKIMKNKLNKEKNDIGRKNVNRLNQCNIDLNSKEEKSNENNNHKKEEAKANNSDAHQNYSPEKSNNYGKIWFSPIQPSPPFDKVFFSKLKRNENVDNKNASVSDASPKKLSPSKYSAYVKNYEKTCKIIADENFNDILVNLNSQDPLDNAIKSLRNTFKNNFKAFIQQNLSSKKGIRSAQSNVTKEMTEPDSAIARTLQNNKIDEVNKNNEQVLEDENRSITTEYLEDDEIDPELKIMQEDLMKEDYIIHKKLNQIQKNLNTDENIIGNPSHYPVETPRSCLTVDQSVYGKQKIMSRFINDVEVSKIEETNNEKNGQSQENNENNLLLYSYESSKLCYTRDQSVYGKEKIMSRFIKDANDYRIMEEISNERNIDEHQNLHASNTHIENRILTRENDRIELFKKHDYKHIPLILRKSRRSLIDCIEKEKRLLSGEHVSLDKFTSKEIAPTLNNLPKTQLEAPKFKHQYMNAKYDPPVKISLDINQKNEKTKRNVFNGYFFPTPSDITKKDFAFDVNEFNLNLKDRGIKQNKDKVNWTGSSSNQTQQNNPGVPKIISFGEIQERTDKLSLCSENNLKMFGSSDQLFIPHSSNHDAHLKNYQQIQKSNTFLKSSYIISPPTTISDLEQYTKNSYFPKSNHQGIEQEKDSFYSYSPFILSQSAPNSQNQQYQTMEQVNSFYDPSISNHGNLQHIAKQPAKYLAVGGSQMHQSCNRMPQRQAIYSSNDDCNFIHNKTSKPSIGFISNPVYNEELQNPRNICSSQLNYHQMQSVQYMPNLLVNNHGYQQKNIAHNDNNIVYNNVRMMPAYPNRMPAQSQEKVPTLIANNSGHSWIPTQYMQQIPQPTEHNNMESQFLHRQIPSNNYLQQNNEGYNFFVENGNKMYLSRP